MFAILHALGMLVADLFKSRCRLEAENLLLRHQLSIALRQAPPRLRLRDGDRALLIWMTRLWPSLLDALQVVQPETVLRWHRAGFKVFWRWKSRHGAGRPRIDRGLRDPIRRMSRENPLWGPIEKVDDERGGHSILLRSAPGANSWRRRRSFSQSLQSPWRRHRATHRARGSWLPMRSDQPCQDYRPWP
jgi:hypothetical protein